jgi:hypothetical protein
MKLKLRENLIEADIGSILLLGFTAFCCAFPLIVHQSLLVSYDINFHLFQSNEFYRSLSSGNIFPKWVLDSNNGYGAANFIFYSPLSYYIVAIFHFFIPSIIQSIIVSIWFAFFLSGISMYYAIKNIADHRAGLICALLYQIFPIHIINLYLRGALAELFAYIWFPLVFISLLRMRNSKEKFIPTAGLAISYAGLILTHLVSGFIFSLIVITYLVYQFFSGESFKRILRIPAALVVGLGLSSFFLLPVVCERKFVQIEYIFEYAFSDFRKNFLFLTDNLHGMSSRFYIPVHIAVMFELVLFLLIIYFKFWKSRKGKENNQSGFFVFLFLLSLFMTTPLSRWFWKLSPTLQAIQFPWRWLSFMELSLLFLTVDFFMKEKSCIIISGGMKGRSVLYLLVTLVLLSGITAFNGKRKIPNEDLNRILYPERAGYYTNLPKEYTPVWAKDLEKLLKKPAPERIAVLSGNAFATVLAWQPEKRVIGAEVYSNALLRVATFYYPGWVARLDGGKVQIVTESNTGEMLVSVPNGKHTLTLEFVDTPLRRSAKYISLISLLFLITAALWIRMRERHS